MDFHLTDSAVRVLGCLIEKEMATPDYYPLSLNALLAACNQKTNRYPVVAYDEVTVVHALDELKSHRFVWQSDASRVPKYGEGFVKLKNLVSREAAVICVLLVRGAQTLGELRSRSDRLFSFSSLDEVGETLESLTEMEMVTKLPRQPGRKENRYSHLLSGEPANIEEVAAKPEAATVVVRAESKRVEELNGEIDDLRRQLKELREEFDAFKAQFE